VVNGLPVTAASEQAVRQAIEELDYVPNHAARTLVTRRTDLIALVLPEPTTRVFSADQFFAGLVHGVSQELEAADKQLVLMLAGSPASHERIERSVAAHHVDGVMLSSLHGADPLPAALTRLGVPVVCNERTLGPASVPYVGVDNLGGAEAAVRHLIASGRRRVATIAGPPDMIAGIDRLAGYRAALGDGARRSIVEVGDFTSDSGAEAMRRLLAGEPDLDAVFAASDLMADGALQTLRRAGRRVPDDVAVVGFDDIDLARYTDPPLTTIRQPIVGIGRRMARQLLSLVAGQEIEPIVTLPTELVIRESA
jgi:DNA-binding LacI/PurR family transcriptional regulator